MYKFGLYEPDPNATHLHPLFESLIELVKKGNLHLAINKAFNGLDTVRTHIDLNL